MPPDGADVDVVQPPGHLRVGIDAVVAARDAGNFQQGEEIQVDALANVTGELRRFDLGPPLASTGPGLGRDGRPRLVVLRTSERARAVLPVDIADVERLGG
jgi:hypothetical protein